MRLILYALLAYFIYRMIRSRLLPREGASFNQNDPSGRFESAEKEQKAHRSSGREKDVTSRSKILGEE